MMHHPYNMLDEHKARTKWAYLYSNNPTNPPAINPMTTGKGTADAGDENETPAINTTASRPSRRTVMNGRMNMQYFSHHRLNAPLRPPIVTGFSSKAFASLTRHFSCILETRRSAAPRTLMIKAANTAKEPSQ